MTDSTKDTAKNAAAETTEDRVEPYTDGSGQPLEQAQPETASATATKTAPETASKPEPEKTPAPNADKGTLFDMRSNEEIAEEKRLANMNQSQKKAEKARKETEDKRKEAEKKKKEEQNRIYEEGTKLRYVGHLGRENRELDRPMNKKQIIEDLQDDYPEVTPERAKFRYDKEKQQIVVTMGSFDKGRL